MSLHAIVKSTIWLSGVKKSCNPREHWMIICFSHEICVKLGNEKWLENSGRKVRKHLAMNIYSIVKFVVKVVHNMVKYESIMQKIFCDISSLWWRHIDATILRQLTKNAENLKFFCFSDTINPENYVHTKDTTLYVHIW